MSKSQRELKALRQAQREEAQRRQRARERRNLILIGSGLAAVAVAIYVIAVALNHATPQAQHLAFQAQASTAVAGLQIADEGTATHIDPSTTWNYKFYPATSGPHYGQPVGPVQWQTIATLSEGIYVHNLEHGGVAILYDCPSGSDCGTLTSQLTNYVNNMVPAEPLFNEYKIVMTPYTHSMTHKVALVAWHWIEWLDSYDQAAITQFYEIHVDQGPEHIA